MARPRLTREESQAQTRQRLLAAARSVFARRGYRGASIDEITAEAGYSKGAVYSNFASKEDMFLEVDRAYMGEEVGKIDRLIGEMTAAKAGRDEVSAALIDWLKSFAADAEWFVLGAELQLHARRDAAFAVKCGSLKDEHRAVLSSLIEKVFAALGKQPPAKPEALASIMIGLSLGLALIQESGARAASAGELMVTAMRAFLDAAPPA